MDPITSEHGACPEAADGTHCKHWWDGSKCCYCEDASFDDGSVCSRCHGDDECICADLGLCCDDGDCDRHGGEDVE